MDCLILHESRGRMRVHFRQRRMTPEQADLIQAWMEAAETVVKARADERTGNVTVWFHPGNRDKIPGLLADFHYETAGSEITVPEHSSRTLTRSYEDRMFFHVIRRMITRFLLPLPLRHALTMAKAVPYIHKAADSLLKGKIEVSVLDAEMDACGISRGTLKRAKDELKAEGQIKYFCTGYGKEKEWYVQLLRQGVTK